MRIFTTILVLLLCTFSGFSQSEQLARNYYEQGEFEKALNVYQKLVNEEPQNPNFFFGLVATHQQLENFSEAEKILLEKVNTSSNMPHFLVELGHNYELQRNSEKADYYYNEALHAIEARPNFAYMIARTFEKYSLLDRAVAAYEKGMNMNPDARYHIQLARLYGEQGEIEKMFRNYIDLLDDNPNLLPSVNRIYGQFITEDPSNEANEIFRKLLVKKLQEDQNMLFNEMLSWLYVQQKEYKKAFLQEKAIYRRSGENLGGIMQLTLMAREGGEPATALELLDFVVEETQSSDIELQAQQMKMNVQQDMAGPGEFSRLENSYRKLLEQYRDHSNILSLQIDFANFLAFNTGKIEEGKTILREVLEKEMSKFEEAAVKMALADILVLDEKFNQALIFYSQIQKLLKNDVIAQMAQYKVAKTSYYKGDFEWAGIQLDVLKAATSQLIANDAMELSLLISDHSREDSTNTALKTYSRADLLGFQNRNREAIALLDTILTRHPGESIEDEALLKQGQLYEKEGEDEMAERNYLRLIELHSNGILADNAHFELAELYAGKLQNPEKAKEFYEKIIFNYADSIYFVDARKKYRALRGDDLE